jgi:hypothetical protein
MWIYYAKLPNTYLKEIVQYGPGYLLKSSTKRRIQLRRTKKFHMTIANERVELFRLLAQVLIYLSSGRSHVGYLYDYPENPIHLLVIPYFKHLLTSG